MLTFRILGPIEVWADGRQLTLGGPRQIALLAVLLLHRNQAVSSDVLVESVWGEAPGGTSKRLPMAIARLRRVLEPGDISSETSLRTVGGGYVLSLGSAVLDADRFETGVSDGRQLLAGGEPAAAAETLRNALSLWRGPPLSEVTFHDFAQAETRRLDELRLTAVEACIDADLELGQHAALIGELEALVAEHWTREHMAAQLMLALYRSGRQTDALEVFQRTRARLTGELGLEPGRALKTLQIQILEQAPELDAAPARPDRPASTGQLPLPIPSGIRDVSLGAYVGRVEEGALVRARWEAARAGPRRCLLVSGEPGIGKTQFVTRAAREFHASGGLVLFGRCTEELAAPYGPWIQLLSPFVENASTEVLTAYVGACGGELARLIPALARRVPEAPAPSQTDPESERYLLFSAVVGLLERASAVAPVVLLLDDLHWADRTTLALLKHVVVETSGMPTLILATYRDSDLAGDHPLTAVLADLHREERVERVRLPGLAEDEVASLLETAADHDGGMGNGVARQISAETDGNPFFVWELIRHLSESGFLARASEGGVSMPNLNELGLPQSVREVVLRRVDRLGEDFRRVLSYASVIGSRFEFELLANVLDADEDELIDVLDTAVDARLLDELGAPSGSFCFAHALINHALYETLGATRRSRIHREVAGALETAYGDDTSPRIEELARHWIAAAPSQLAKAQLYSKRAGERALAKLAPDEAVGWFEQVLHLLEATPEGDRTERCEVRILLGEAQRQAGRPEYRATLLSAARMAEEMQDAERMARAALANSRGFASTFGVVDHERIAVLQRAVELDHFAHPARCAQLLSLQAMELQFDPDHIQRRALAGEALALARAAGDDRGLALVLRNHFHATWGVDTLDDRRNTAEEMARLADTTDDPLVRIWALDRTIHVAVESGALSEARDALRRLQTLTDQLGQPGLRWHATYFAAGLAQLHGELEEAERLAEAAAQLGQQGAEPDMIFIYFGQMCMVRVEQGRASEVIEVLEQAAADNSAVPSFEAAYAAVLCDLGRESEAALMLERSARRQFADIPQNQVYSTAIALWARVAGDVRAEREAAVLYDLIEPWGDQFVWNGAMGYGAAQHYLGVLAATLGAYDRAREHFAAASRFHEREGVKAWECRNLCTWSACLLASGATADSLAMAERTLEMARENGFGHSAHRAEQLIHLAAVT